MGDIADFDAYRTHRLIRAADKAAQDDAIANMKVCTDNLIAAYLSKDEFRILRESEAADAARWRLIALMSSDV
jgi:hypothetical protein